MRIKRAYWGTDDVYIDVTPIVESCLEKSPSFKAGNEVFSDPAPGIYKKLTVVTDDKTYTTFETSFFSFHKKKLIKEKLGYYSIKEKAVYDYIDSIDENTDCFEEHLVFTIINHTTKTGIVVSKPDTYAGFYCYVAYYFKKMRDIVSVYGYKLDRLFTLDGFTIYKDNNEDDLYQLIFQKNDSPDNFFRQWFSPSELVLSKIKEIKTKHDINTKRTIGVYYRGTDKIREIKLPTVDEYYKVIDTLDSDFKIFLQTDQQQVLDGFKNKYGNRVVYLDELPLSSTSKSTYHTQKENRVKNAIEFNAALTVLSQCHTLLMTDGSNVSGYLWKIRSERLNKTSTYSIK